MAMAGGSNNNPYNQDNETSWLDWRRLDTHRDAVRFTRLMIAFRRAHPSLCLGRRSSSIFRTARRTNGAGSWTPGVRAPMTSWSPVTRSR